MDANMKKRNELLAYKKANDQIGDLTGRTSNCSKCLFSYETADNNSICRIINLLKKCSKYNRKEK